MRSYALLLLVAIALSTSGARAEAPDELVEKGLQLRRDRQDAEALALFRRANDARPTPRTRAQIALAEQALGRWEEAERDLLLAMQAVDDAWILSHRETLNKALDTIRKHLGTLAVESNAPDAELWMNDALVGKLPLGPVRVAAGTVRLEVRAAGHAPSARSVEIAAGATARERFELKAQTEPQKRPAEAPVIAPPAATEANATSVPTSSAPITTPSDTRRAFAWATLGAAGAFLGGAIAAQLVREENAARYNDDSRCLFGDLSRDQRCGVYRGQAESAQGLANVGYVAAGVLGVASTILFLTSGTASKTGGIRFGLDVGSTGAEVTMGGKM